MRFKIDWASLIVGGKLPFLLCFILYLRAIFQVKAPRGLIFGGAILQRVFCVTSLGGLYLEGLIHGGAYFRNFTVSLNLWLTEYYLQRVHVIHWLDCGVGCIPGYIQNYNKQGYALRKKIWGAQNTNPLTFWLPSIVILGKN